MKVLIVDHFFHKKTASNYFLLDLLKRRECEITYRYDYYEEEYGRSDEKDKFSPTIIKSREFDRIIVWQSEQALRSIISIKGIDKSKVFFFPMYDSAVHWRADFYALLKDGISVVSFCRDLAHRLRRHGIDSIYLKYFPEPRLSKEPPHSTNRGVKVLYWHRRTDYEPYLLRALNRVGPREISALTIKDVPDPKNKQLSEQCREILGSLKKPLKTLEWQKDSETWLQTLREFDMAVASRVHEGIGLGFLEFMASGIPVVGVAAPTLTEYVIDGYNGILLNAEKGKPDPRFDINELSRIRKNLYRTVKDYSDAWKNCYARHLEIALFGNARLNANLDGKQPAQVQRTTRPLLSIITVVRNDSDGLLKTYDSIKAQTFQNFEWIVWDGKSNPELLKEIAKVAQNADTFVSESDSGPYDAMNKAVELAKGKYVCFMNAGDEFAYINSLMCVFSEKAADADLIYCDYFYIDADGRSVPKSPTVFEKTYTSMKAGNVDYEWIEGMPCHQAVFTKREALSAFPFELNYKVAADHGFYFKLFSSGATFEKRSVPVAKYFAGGYSAQNGIACISDWRDISLRYTGARDKCLAFYARMACDELTAKKYNVEVQRDLLRRSQLFDEAFYLAQVGKDVTDPIEHYCIEGWRKNLSPSATFITSEYLEHNRDVKERGLNPFLHFVLFGQYEGRNPSSIGYQLRNYAESLGIKLTYPEISGVFSNAARLEAAIL